MTKDNNKSCLPTRVSKSHAALALSLPENLVNFSFSGISCLATLALPRSPLRRGVVLPARRLLGLVLPLPFSLGLGVGGCTIVDSSPLGRGIAFVYNPNLYVHYAHKSLQGYVNFLWKAYICFISDSLFIISRIPIIKGRIYLMLHLSIDSLLYMYSTHHLRLPSVMTPTLNVESLGIQT